MDLFKLMEQKSLLQEAASSNDKTHVLSWLDISTICALRCQPGFISKAAFTSDSTDRTVAVPGTALFQSSLSPAAQGSL